jgi:hypothetical protein
MDFTMLKQMTRFCMFLAFLHNTAASNPEMDIFANILEPGNFNQGPAIKPIDDAAQATYLAHAPHLDTVIYDMILQYLNLTGHRGQYHHHHSHFQENALVLPPRAKKLTEFHQDGGRTYSCSSSHKGNSFIQFYDREIRGYRTGVIKLIFEMPLQGFLRKFILVSPHRELRSERTPYDQTMYPRFMSKIVEVEPSDEMIVIEPEHIITHLTTYETGGHLYGIKTKVLIICWALNRGRKEYLPT